MLALSESSSLASSRLVRSSRERNSSRCAACGPGGAIAWRAATMLEMPYFQHANGGSVGRVALRLTVEQH